MDWVVVIRSERERWTANYSSHMWPCCRQERTWWGQGQWDTEGMRRISVCVLPDLSVSKSIIRAFFQDVSHLNDFVTNKIAFSKRLRMPISISKYLRNLHWRNKSNYLWPPVSQIYLLGKIFFNVTPMNISQNMSLQFGSITWRPWRRKENIRLVYSFQTCFKIIWGRMLL